MQKNPQSINMSSILFRIFLLGMIVTMSCKLVNETTITLVDPTSTGVIPSQETAPSTSEVSTPAEVTPEIVQPSDTPFPSIMTRAAVRFAVYTENVIPVSPNVRQQSVESELRNVENPFILSPQQIEKITHSGFVISPGTDKEFYMLYEQARYDNVPVFVTSDALLHSYHLLFDKVLRTAELERFIPLLNQLNLALLAQTDAQYQQLIGTSWEDAAMRTVAYFGVGTRLLDRQSQIPAYAETMVEQELMQIDAAAGMLPSPIFPGLEFGEDYTQYIPRGHYTRNEALQAYFKSMMWYGRMTFRLKSMDPTVGRNETRSAILLVNALRNANVNGKPAETAWEELYAPTVFFVGRSDDLTAIQYGDVIDAVFGANPSLQTITTDESKFDQFIELAYQLPAARILGLVIAVTDDEQISTKGLRFMGQRFVPDAYIFRQLIYRNVGTAENRRGLPKGLDVMAAMGSQRAYDHLSALGETQYENYPQQMEKARQWLSGLSVDEWTETLYNTWLYSFLPLLAPTSEGFPEFMRSEAWLDKQLNTSLGSWAELKHDTILYAKQVYAEMGGGPPPPEPVPPRGYVEPVPLFYARLAALTEMTRTGLETRGLLNEVDRESLNMLEDLARALQVMSDKELRAEPLTNEEYERIRFIGGELEDIVMRSADWETAESNPAGQMFLDEDPQAAVIADVATDPDPGAAAGGKPIVLEVGVGRINVLHAIVPLPNPDGTVSLQVAKGGVFSYYEFPWPAEDRLTDEKWRTMVANGETPQHQEWMNSFLVAEGEYSRLREAVRNYQNLVSQLYWTPMDAEYYLNPATEWLTGETDALNTLKQYIGHQLVSTTFRSFDRQDPNTIVVTVREIWQDSLHAYQSDYPTFDEAPIGQRGPYILDVTYTIVRNVDNNSWEVSRVVYNNMPPGW